MTPRVEPSLSPSTPRAPGVTAYGFAIDGLEAATVLAPEDGAQLPTITVEQRRLDLRQLPPWADDHFRIDAEAGELALVGGGRLVLDRVKRRATYLLLERIDDDELAHPSLAPSAAVFARWAGMEAFHATTFVAGAGAWALLGDKEAGKSTLAAALALRGHSIVADDLLVVADGAALAGPRCVDLRLDTLGRLGPVSGGRPSRAAARQRLDLPPIARSTPLEGFVYLCWSNRAELVRIPVAQCLSRLAGERFAPSLPSDPVGVLELGALPAYELRRPRDWGMLAATIDALLGAMAPASDAGGARPARTPAMPA